jgi:tRNA-specific 2-thiouridylase
MSKGKVFVGMSGGVDSSVAAYLLKGAGYDVTGFTMLILEDASSGSAAKNVADARRVADLLGIPHHVLDVREEFKRAVIDYFVTSYLAGETPNPCAVCNRQIKFGLIFREMQERGLDFLATGHFARLKRDGNRTLLCEAKDRTKSQAYFLALLNHPVLRHCLFPIGDYAKPEVRAIARRANLPVSERRESQQVCFVPDNDCAAFIKHRAPLKPVCRSRSRSGFWTGTGRSGAGIILDTSRNPVGRHKGYYHYTIGQRRNLGSSFGSPRYVIRIEPETNTIIIGEKKDLYSRTCTVRGVNWMALPRQSRGGDNPPAKLRAEVRIRYRSHPAPATLIIENDGVCVEFDEPQCAITPGQLAVFNDGEVILGGGWIQPLSPIPSRSDPAPERQD